MERLREFADRVKSYMWLVGLYLAIAGTVTFSMFIHEEAIQTAIWGTWPAMETKQWHIAEEGLQVVDKINFSLKCVNYSLGWVQPLALLSYHHYIKSTDYYLKGARSKIFAHAPEIYLNKEVEFQFVPKEIRLLQDQTYLAINGKMAVKYYYPVKLQEVRGSVIKGVLEKGNGYMFVRQE